MSTQLDDETLRDLLVDQMSQSKEFDSEVKTYYRESDMKTYDVLIGCIGALPTPKHDEEEPPATDDLAGQAGRWCCYSRH